MNSHGDIRLRMRHAPQRFPLTFGVAVIAVFMGAAVVLAATGTTQIRYSADHDRTIGIWEIWIPVAIALLAARLLPRQLPRVVVGATERHLREARDCVAIAVAFAVGVIVFDSWLLALKIGFLAIAPLLVLSNRTWLVGIPERSAYRGWWWIGPTCATTIWLTFTWIGPYARSTSSTVTVAALLGGLVLNVYIEERFYRGWLQTRLEHVIGRWSAIGAAAVLWATWHLAIHSTQRPLIDAATVLAHHGTIGILLGYLWARFRNPWPLLVIHAAMNTSLDLLRSVSLT